MRFATPGGGHRSSRGLEQSRAPPPDPFHLLPLPAKVGIPFVAAGMEERHKFAGIGINARQVRTLAEITAVAGQCQIGVAVGSPVLLGHNVLDMVCQVAVLLGQKAIFATIHRPTPDEVARGGVHR